MMSEPLLQSPLPRYLLLDGGLATELAWTHGHQHIDADPLWSARLLVSHVDAITAAHTNFLAAGCDVIETVTYQASVEGFSQHLGLSKEEALHLIKQGAHVAIAAREDFWDKNKHKQGMKRALVAGSVGPYGAVLHDASEYTGAYTHNMSIQDLCEWHRPRVEALLEAGVDLLAIDTIPALKEAQALATLLQEYPLARAWLAFSCKDGSHLCHGETFSDAAQALLSSKQIFGIGINCTAPEHVESLLRSLPAEVKRQKTIVVYPNSGEQWSKQHKWYGAEDTQPLHSYVWQWMAEGAEWIGGCCRVGPDQLTLIKQCMQDYIDQSK